MSAKDDPSTITSRLLGNLSPVQNEAAREIIRLRHAYSRLAWVSSQFAYRAIRADLFLRNDMDKNALAESYKELRDELNKAGT